MCVTAALGTNILISQRLWNVLHTRFSGSVVWYTLTLVWLTKTHLGNKDQAESNGAAKDDDQSYDAELDVGLISRQERHRGTDDAHDAHIVHTHPNVFAVIESRDADVPRLPGQETTKQLRGK